MELISNETRLRCAKQILEEALLKIKTCGVTVTMHVNPDAVDLSGLVSVHADNFRFDAVGLYVKLSNKKHEERENTMKYNTKRKQLCEAVKALCWKGNGRHSPVARQWFRDFIARALVRFGSQWSRSQKLKLEREQRR